MKTHRMIIHPKDVQRITGKSDRYGRFILQKIRAALHKGANHYVTVEEFCQFTGLEIEQVNARLGEK